MYSEDKDLFFRVGGTKDKTPEIVVYDLDQCMQHFSEIVESMKAMSGAANDLARDGKVAEAKNIWRAQVAFLASDFDFYMHELTKFGLCEIFDENWSYTPRYDNLQVSMKYVRMATHAGDNAWLLQFENGYFQHVTMMSYDSVSEQLKLLGINVTDVARKVFGPEKKENALNKCLKRKLDDLSARRNIIVHQADRKEENAEEYDITEDDVNDFIADIVCIVSAIDYAARNKRRLK